MEKEIWLGYFRYQGCVERVTEACLVVELDPGGASVRGIETQIDSLIPIASPLESVLFG